MALHLGPFRLEVPIARGGMSEVWRGHHDPSGVRVAVKMLPRALDDRHSRGAFEAEVRAVARLDHPGIVHVIDYGRVDAEASHNSRKRLKEGAPWIVMEYASGGSLAQLGALPEWTTLRAVLLSVLDALAHAHARGLVHRDLKPGNVLLCTGTDDRPGLKLTDFGIAQATDAAPDRGFTAGTLQYMAPEQIRGAWSDIGPWTDLYGLGCMAWALATGQTPFGHLAFEDVRAAHLEIAPPVLKPTFEVPFGFGHWVSCLLAKRPEDRFKRAAEAAVALLALSGDDQLAFEDPRRTPTAHPRLEQLRQLAPGLIVAQPTTLAIDLLGPGLAGVRPTWRPTALSASSGPVPEIPPTWRHPIPRPPPQRLRGAGVGLLGFRDHRLLGRDDALDAAWARALSVSAAKRTGLVLVRGQAGAGRSRLVGSVAERLHELGIAEVLGGQVESKDRGVDCLWRAVAHRLGLVQPLTLEANTAAEALLGPGRDAQVLAARLLGQRIAPAEENGVLSRAIDALGSGRMTVVLLDDIDRDPQGIDWVLGMLERPEAHDRATLILATVREDRAVDPEVADALTSLERHSRATTLQLNRLDPGFLHALVRDILGLEASAAGRVVDAAGGNPGFAVSVVREWARRGLLRDGQHGFELASGSDVEVPADLAEALLARAREATSELPTRAWLDLELAAVMGDPVSSELWDAACAGDPVIRLALVEELVDGRLAELVDGGWHFATATLREALVQNAAAGDRLVDHHLACARALEDRGFAADDAEIGLHLLGAGDPAAAIAPLLRSVDSTADQYRGLDRVARLEEALERASVPETDPRWARVRVRRAGLCMRAGRYEEAASWAEWAMAMAELEGWPELSAMAAFERAVVAMHRHRGDGPNLAAQAVELARRAGDSRLVARAGYLWAAAAAERRDWEVAEERYATVLQQFCELEDVGGQADCHRDLGNLALFRGELEAAELRYERALALFQEGGAAIGEAHARNGLADVSRKRGQLAEAEAGYAAALRCFDRVGAGQGMLARLNLGLVLVERKEWSRARELLEGTRSWLQEQQRITWVAAAGAVLLPAYASLGDREAYDRTATSVLRDLKSSSFAQPDVLWAAEQAIDVCEQLGDLERADAARLIAELQRERLGAR